MEGDLAKSMKIESTHSICPCNLTSRNYTADNIAKVQTGACAEFYTEMMEQQATDRKGPALGPGSLCVQAFNTDTASLWNNKLLHTISIIY